MSDIPRRTTSRTVKLAGIPLGVAGRAAAGFGRRLTGGDRDEISAQMAKRAAEQLFAVLGELKGGAMKFGQALSVFEAAVPDEYAEPYREALTKLQSAAPPMPMSDVDYMLTQQFGRSWRGRFAEFDETPAAAASIGQVHRAIWKRDGREVAVKVQYPGAEEALRSDLRQLGRMSRILQPLIPDVEVRPLVEELRNRMEEELDYRDEAAYQREFAALYEGDPEVKIPRVVGSAPKAVVTEWVQGRPLASIIREGTPAERDHAGTRLARFHYSAPDRAHLLHADPHPGNFGILDDGRLLVLDFGAVARMPDGMPPELVAMTKFALEGREDELMSLMRSAGFLRDGARSLPEQILGYLAPFTQPLETEEFHFSRRWLQAQAERVGDIRTPEAAIGRSLNLPPRFLLVHRVTMGTVGILCQLDAHVRLREIVARWQPEMFDRDSTPG